MTDGSSMVAMSCIGPPHRGQARTSISNARRIRSAHAQYRRLSLLTVAGSSRLAAEGSQSLRLRAAVGHDQLPPSGVRGEHAVIDDEVDPGVWRQGGELLEEFERLEEEVHRAVVPLGLQRDEDAAVGCEPLLRNRWAEQVAAE